MKSTPWAPLLSLMLAACSGLPPGSPPAERPASEVQGRTEQPPRTARVYRPGMAVVESASVVSLPSSSSAAGGATGPTMAYRLRMADGSLQHVVQTGERFELGERVMLTQDGRLARP